MMKELDLNAVRKMMKEDLNAAMAAFKKNPSAMQFSNLTKHMLAYQWGETCMFQSEEDQIVRMYRVGQVEGVVSALKNNVLM